MYIKSHFVIRFFKTEKLLFTINNYRDKNYSNKAIVQRATLLVQCTAVCLQFLSIFQHSVLDVCIKYRVSSINTPQAHINSQQSSSNSQSLSKAQQHSSNVQFSSNAQQSSSNMQSTYKAQQPSLSNGQQSPYNVQQYPTITQASSSALRESLSDKHAPLDQHKLSASDGHVDNMENSEHFHHSITSHEHMLITVTLGFFYLIINCR